MSKLQIDIDDSGGATLCLNNPAKHNAFDDLLIAEMTVALQRLALSSQVRVITLCARGKSFSAGADLNWMRRSADYTRAENRRDAQALANLLKTLNELPKPTIALVQGAAFGGGVGLIAACDIAFATTQAVFCLSEVRLGLVPATISPYLLAAIGEREARRYLLSAERFSAEQALRIGLIHQVVRPEQLEDSGLRLQRRLLRNGPQALTATKRLIREVAGRPIDNSMINLTAETIATARATKEAKEGIDAFLNTRRPDWDKGPER